MYVCTVVYSIIICTISYIHNVCTVVYSTAHVQVYKQTHVTHRALRKFEDNSCIGLMRHEEYTARERLLMS